MMLWPWLPDWRVADQYSALFDAERKALAWEWLRRTNDYQRAWHNARGRSFEHVQSRRFGLEQFEDPNLPTPHAKPVWCSDIDPAVITAGVRRSEPDISYHVDLFDWRDFATIVIDESHDEHVLLSDGMRFLRLDIVEGTLIGCPARLSFYLKAAGAMRTQVRTLSGLAALSLQGHFSDRPPAGRILERWILELRVADALERGARHHEIARVLFGSVIPERNWRTTSTSYRLRVQRLARQARKRLACPLDRTWFA